MGLETATYIHQLDASNPTSSDQKSQGDDHIRLTKATLQATLPNITGPVTATQGDLNKTSALSGGVYTPTATAIANCSGLSPQQHYYERVGTAVVVYGRINLTITSGSLTNTSLRITLPVASNLLSGDAAGHGFVEAANLSNGLINIQADSANDQLTIAFAPTNAGSYTLHYSAMYVIK